MMKRFFLVFMAALWFITGCAKHTDDMTGGSAEGVDAIDDTIKNTGSTGIDNSKDLDCLHDFLETEKGHINAVLREMKKNASPINIEKQGVTLTELATSFKRLYITFLSSEPLPPNAAPTFIMDGYTLPTPALAEEYSGEGPEGFVTVYSAYMERRRPFLAGISLVHIQLLGSDYIFEYDWYLKEPRLSDIAVKEEGWLKESAQLASKVDLDNHTLSPSKLIPEDIFRVVPQSVTMQKNILIFEGTVEVLTQINNSYRVDACLEAGGNAFYGENSDVSKRWLHDTILSKKGSFPIGWKWTLPLYYQDWWDGDAVFIRVEITNQATSETSYYLFLYHK